MKHSWINDDDLQVARNLTLLFLSCAILIFICFPSCFTQESIRQNNVYFLFRSQRDSYLTSSLKVFNEEMKLNFPIRLTTVTTRVIALWVVWASLWMDRREWITSVAMFLDLVKVSALLFHDKGWKKMTSVFGRFENSREKLIFFLFFHIFFEY